MAVSFNCRLFEAQYGFQLRMGARLLPALLRPPQPSPRCSAQRRAWPVTSKKEAGASHTDSHRYGCCCFLPLSAWLSLSSESGNCFFGPNPRFHGFVLLGVLEAQPEVQFGFPHPLSAFPGAGRLSCGCSWRQHTLELEVLPPKGDG